MGTQLIRESKRHNKERGVPRLVLEPKRSAQDPKGHQHRTPRVSHLTR
jgi:hypothetical protein